MKRHLLDVNILIAIIWPSHQEHASARSWFEKSGYQLWASNPLTQLGVLRLLTNPALTYGMVSVTAALTLLNKATQHSKHEFWPLDRTVATSLGPVISRVRGYKQWTDALLLCQAAERDGVLVTFDAGIKELAPNELKDRVLLLNSTENQVNGIT
jgi:uncharacterized protein